MPSGADSEYLAYVNGRVIALRRTAYLLSGDAHEADDIVQETLTKLYTRWRRIQHVDNLDAYVNRVLGRVLSRVLLDDRRRGWWRVALLDWLPDRPDAPDDRPLLRAALAQVPPRPQAVLVLRFLCDQSIRDVAEFCTAPRELPRADRS
jgi:RNA polymerase sigma factor (sigma-70 family)